MADTIPIPAEILATDVRLGEPVPLLDGQVSAYGDLDLLQRLGLTSFTPSTIAFREKVERLADRDTAESLHDMNTGGMVARYGGFAIKYCWEAPAIQEGFMSEAMRLGLAATEDEVGHGITVPKIVACVSSQDRGVLVMGHVRGHRQVVQYGHVLSNRFLKNGSLRIRLYRDALRAVGLAWPADNLEVTDFDDYTKNTLWPASFFPVGEGALPTSSVRLDFGMIAKRLREHLSPLLPGHTD